MDPILSRDKTQAVALLSTYGTASLLSRDGHEVKVPLAPLLGASTLVRSVVAESNLHPGAHGPLVLSFEVSADALGSVVDILGIGESTVKEENIKEVMHVLESLGVEANLKKIRKTIVYEHIVTNEEDVQLEKLFGTKSDQESELIEGGVNKAKDNLLGVELKLSQSKKNIECRENDASNEEDDKLEIILEPVCDVETNLSNCDVYEAKDNSTEGKKPYKCHICNYSFSSSGVLKRHIRNHTGERPYKCTICNYCCSRAYALKVHNRIHSEEKLFRCQICTYSCSNPSNLVRHNRTHTGEKPFKCKICEYSCSDPGHLKVHHRMHTGEKPYCCKICNKTFSKSSHLIEHRESHTDEKYTCDICKKSFSRPSYLRKHGKIHIGEKKS